MASLERRDRIAFAFWGAALLAAIAVIAAVALGQQSEGIPGLLRSVLDFNGGIWSGLLSPARMTNPAVAPARPPRFNGDLGLDEDDFDPATWTLELEGRGVPGKLALKLADLQWAPATETSTEFRCIEGWSDPMSYAGLRFSDFLRRFGLGRRSGAPWTSDGPPDDLYSYVGLETPDGEYYVSIDMESMLHPQTLLVWTMNGQPLSLKNGAPLRLLIPIKYGIKSLKRIGRIFFSDQRPRDYWAERGYDWFAGL